MALRFSVSAPGKVILSGEHSVVYGKVALAGVIGLRNTLTFEATNKTHIALNFDLSNESWTIKVAVYNVFLKNVAQQYAGLELPSAINHEDFLAKVKSFVDENVRGVLTGSEGFEKARCAVVYLLTGILIDSGCSELKHGFVIGLKTGLTMGAGLGSSASFGVCLATTFLFYSTYRLTPKCIEAYNACGKAERADIQAKISSWAFCSERLMHGNPSGLDNTICTIGSLLKFRKGHAWTEVELRRPLHVLMINTGVDRSTSTLVARVAALREEFPELLSHLLDGMGSVVEDIITVLLAGTDDAGNFDKLERLVNINNNLLRSIGVSHARLEQIFEISRRHGFSSKLTGAGGGGYAIVMLPDLYETLQSYGDLCAELSENGLEWTATTVGGKGVEITEC